MWNNDFLGWWQVYMAIATSFSPPKVVLELGCSLGYILLVKNKTVLKIGAIFKSTFNRMSL